MITRKLYFATGAEAARATGIAQPDIHLLLVGGRIPGAFQAANRHWRVPVDSLEDLGFDVDRSEAFYMSPSEALGESEEVALEPEPTPVVEEPRSPLGALVNYVSELEERCAQLAAELETARTLAQEREQHYKELRSILDYATNPN